MEARGCHIGHEDWVWLGCPLSQKRAKRFEQKVAKETKTDQESGFAPLSGDGSSASLSLARLPAFTKESEEI
jgi:hypothetical protein